jgi:hypothetical protein
VTTYYRLGASALGASRLGVGLLNQRPLLCREAMEESTFAGHFWEPRSSDLGVVSFDGLMRSSRI